MFIYVAFMAIQKFQVLLLPCSNDFNVIPSIYKPGMLDILRPEIVAITRGFNNIVITVSINSNPARISMAVVTVCGWMARSVGQSDDCYTAGTDQSQNRYRHYFKQILQGFLP
jgi:hypothetical protein